MDHHTPLPPQEPVVMPLVHRAAVPVAVFALSLLAFMMLSERYVLPALLTMRLPGAVLLSEDVLPRRRQLQEELRTLEAYREERIVRRDPLQQFLREQTQDRDGTVGLLDAALRVTREQAAVGGTIVLRAVTADAGAQTVRLEGELSAQDPGTMSLLAAFIDDLSGLLNVSSVDASPFVRERSADGRFLSPFTLTVHGL